jgi:hypothetical protein
MLELAETRRMRLALELAGELYLMMVDQVTPMVSS